MRNVVMSEARGLKIPIRKLCRRVRVHDWRVYPSAEPLALRSRSHYSSTRSSCAAATTAAVASVERISG